MTTTCTREVRKNTFGWYVEIERKRIQLHTRIADYRYVTNRGQLRCSVSYFKCKEQTEFLVQQTSQLKIE